MTDEGPLLAFTKKPKVSESGKITLSIQKISWLLEMARTRDEIAEYILQFSQMYLKRVALFILRKDMGFGWDGRGEGINRSLIRSLVIQLGGSIYFQNGGRKSGAFFRNCT